MCISMYYECISISLPEIKLVWKLSEQYYIMHKTCLYIYMRLPYKDNILKFLMLLDLLICNPTIYCVSLKQEHSANCEQFPGKQFMIFGLHSHHSFFGAVFELFADVSMWDAVNFYLHHYQ